MCLSRYTGHYHLAFEFNQQYKRIKAAFTLYRYNFGAVQVKTCSSFLVGTKLYPIAGTKLYRITVSSVNVRLIRNTFVSDQKVTWCSLNAA